MRFQKQEGNEIDLGVNSGERPYWSLYVGPNMNRHSLEVASEANSDMITSMIA